MAFCRKVGSSFLGALCFTRSCYHSSFTVRTHTCGELREKHVGRHVTLCGWMNKPRRIGSLDMAFIPLSDSTGTTQLVCENKEMLDAVHSLNTESVIKVEGLVIRRPGSNTNKNMPTGAVEVEVQSLVVLNKADLLPFLPYSKATAISEEMTLKERHLHIRRPSIYNILRFRSKVSSVIRKYFNQNGFIEVETPTLFKPTPEGAKEFIVPTQEHGQFYSLVQSPQQFKQLLMVGGIDRYFQFARCYRDESSRSDRQPEFTQIDLEMSFTTEEGIMNMMEELMVEVFVSALPNVAPPTRPFPVMSYRQAMDEYGTDKPDTRYDMKLHSLSDQWRQCISGSTSLIHLMDLELVGFYVPQWKEMAKKFHSNEWRELFTTVRDSSTQSATILSFYSEKAQILVDADDGFAGRTLSHSIAQCPDEVSDALSRVVAGFGGYGEGGYIIAAYGRDEKKDEVLQSLGRLRTSVAAKLFDTGILSIPSNLYRFLWVTEFPLFSMETDDNGNEVIKATHHPFTAPRDDQLATLHSATSLDELTKITAQHYDLVVNGWELGGGSIRIHDADLQKHVLTTILDTGTDKFRHLLNGLRSGCPPHGGIALGFDRMIAILSGASSLRDVIAFPKSTTGRDLLMGSPAPLTPEELKEYGIELTND